MAAVSLEFELKCGTCESVDLIEATVVRWQLWRISHGLCASSPANATAVLVCGLDKCRTVVRWVP